jgi:hypothetical protein
MPEFILDHGSPEGVREFNKLDAFTQGYIEAMFFTNTGTADDEDEGLHNATFAELAPETLKDIERDCQQFQASNTYRAAVAARDGIAGDMGLVTFDDEQAGNDFWFTRNGHGVGFWDRADEVYGTHQDALDKAAKAWGSVDIYRGDDGLIYTA